MRHDVRQFSNIPAAGAGSSDVLKIEDLREVAVFVGTPAGAAVVGIACKLQGSPSLNGASINEWLDIATLNNAQVTAGARIDVPTGYTRLRITMTGYTSGTIAAVVSGKNSRTV